MSKKCELCGLEYEDAKGKLDHLINGAACKSIVDLRRQLTTAERAGAACAAMQKHIQVDCRTCAFKEAMRIARKSTVEDGSPADMAVRNVIALIRQWAKENT
jgi:hypothetical protein